MAAGRFVKAAARLIKALGEGRCAVAGGIAVNAYGYVRATRDVDIIVAIPLSEARRLLEEHGISVRLLRGNPLDGEFSCLKGVLELGKRAVEAVPFDVLPQLVPFDPWQSVELTVHGESMRVVDVDTLIRLKLKAAGPKDLYDIAILVNLEPAWKERAMAFAAADKDLSTRLKTFIDDPRAIAQAREAQSHNRLFESRAKRRKKA
jgi:hypothetical protein